VKFFDSPIQEPSRYAGMDAHMNALMAQSLGGCSLSYRQFLDELSKVLSVYFRKRLFDAGDEVDDLVQETVLAIHYRRHTYRTELPVMAWVYAIARHKLIDWLRQRGSKPHHLTLETSGAQEVEGESATVYWDAWWDLRKYLKELPGQQGQLIVHTKIDGYSVQETAHLMGMSEAAVKTGVHRGIKALSLALRQASSTRHKLGPV
jgi:RNA polymerase sigma-70 factor, ECF subfamily